MIKNHCKIVSRKFVVFSFLVIIFFLNHLISNEEKFPQYSLLNGKLIIYKTKEGWFLSNKMDEKNPFTKQLEDGNYTHFEAPGTGKIYATCEPKRRYLEVFDYNGNSLTYARDVDPNESDPDLMG